MQPLIAHFSTFSFLSSKDEDQRWCCLSHLVSYFHIDAYELFLIFMNRLNMLSYESTLEISTDSGETFQRRSKEWIVNNISFFAANEVFVPSVWVESLVEDFVNSLTKQTDVILSRVAQKGYFALRSTSNMFLDPYYKLLAEFVKQTDPMSVRLLYTKDHQDHTLEFAWVFWNQLLYRNPSVVISSTSVELPLVQIQGKGQIRYCLEQIQ